MSNLIGFMIYFRKYRKVYERAIKSVQKEIEEYFEDTGEDFIHYIRGRVKTGESITDKAAKKKYDDVFEQMDDIAGVRVVCHNESDIEQVAAYIQMRYSGSIKEDKPIKKDRGYKAHHFVIYVQVLVAGMSQRTKVEIQLRSLAQDLFDTLSRRDMYKIPALPEEWINKMEDLGKTLEHVDSLADELKREWIAINLSTRLKDSLTAQAIKQIVKAKLNHDMTLPEAMNCLSNLVVGRGIEKICELESILAHDEIMLVVDSIYEELLERKADPNGKIIYGSFLYKRWETEENRKAVIETVKESIQRSKEYGQNILAKR